MLDYNTEFTVNTVDMNLAETCNYLQISTINAINEFQTTVLLSEYGYLLENGCEIDYDTDGNDIITEGVMDLFTKIKEWIKATYEKLVNWITDRIDDVRQWFSKVGLKKEKASKAVKIYAEAYRGFDKQFLPTFSGLWVNVKKLESACPALLKDIQSKMNSSKMEDVINKAVNKFKDAHTEDVPKDIIIPVEYAAIACANVFDTGNVVKSIRTSQAQAIKQIEDMMHIAQRSNADAAVIDNLKNGIRAVSDVSRELVKLYRDGIQSSITILKKVISCISNTDAVARAYRKVGNIRKAKIAGAIIAALAAAGIIYVKMKNGRIGKQTGQNLLPAGEIRNGLFLPAPNNSPQIGGGGNPNPPQRKRGGNPLLPGGGKRQLMLTDGSSYRREQESIQQMRKNIEPDDHVSREAFKRFEERYRDDIENGKMTNDRAATIVHNIKKEIRAEDEKYKDRLMNREKDMQKGQNKAYFDKLNRASKEYSRLEDSRDNLKRKLDKIDKGIKKNKYKGDQLDRVMRLKQEYENQYGIVNKKMFDLRKLFPALVGQ